MMMCYATSNKQDLIKILSKSGDNENQGKKRRYVGGDYARVLEAEQRRKVGMHKDKRTKYNRRVGRETFFGSTQTMSSPIVL